MIPYYLIQIGTKLGVIRSETICWNVDDDGWKSRMVGTDGQDNTRFLLSEMIFPGEALSATCFRYDRVTQYTTVTYYCSEDAGMTRYGAPIEKRLGWALRTQTQSLQFLPKRVNSHAPSLKMLGYRNCFQDSTRSVLVLSTEIFCQFFDIC